MSEYSRPLGDTVKKARKKMGLTQNLVAIMTDSDERTIMSIKNCKANTAMEVLYPLISTLRIDPREIFCPEIDKESPAHYQLQLLINDCSEEEPSALIPVCQVVISALRTNDGIPIKEKEPASLESGKQALRLTDWLICLRPF